MRDFSENNVFLRYTAQIVAWVLCLAAIGFGIWTIYFTETGNGDNVEHLHCTWLVAQGKIPYKDFFQHHNPLMWYIFAPIIGQYTKAIELLDFGHTVGIITGILTFFVVYKICRRFYKVSFLSAMTSLLIVCPPYYYIFCFNYNPDTFMALAFAGGLYYLFAYLEKNKQLDLCLAFIIFFAAFMFTQKILTTFAVLGPICLYLFIKRKTPIEHLFFALLLPVWCLVAFGAYLYNNGILETYWKSNYIFNMVMEKYYGDNQVAVSGYQVMILSTVLAIIAILFFFRKENIFYKIIAILFVIELPQRCFFFSIAPYYLLPMMIYIACLNSVLIEKITKKCFVLIYILLGVSCFYLYISRDNYVMARGTDRAFARFMSQTITPCDYVISSYMGNQSLVSKDPHYYWSILGHVDMVGEEIGVAHHPNISALVERYKPKLVFGGVYWSSYDANRGRQVFIQQVSPEILEKYYMPTRFMEFYMLKYEYRKKNCRYDKDKGEWLYAD